MTKYVEINSLKLIFRYSILKRNIQIPNVLSLWFSERTYKKKVLPQTSRT